MTDVNVTIGKRIRFRRKMMGLTLKQLGEKVLVSYQMVQKNECADCKLSAESLVLYADALGVNLDYFFDNTQKIVLPIKSERIATILFGLTEDQLEIIKRMALVFKNSNKEAAE